MISVEFVKELIAWKNKLRYSRSIQWSSNLNKEFGSSPVTWDYL